VTHERSQSDEVVLIRGQKLASEAVPQQVGMNADSDDRAVLRASNRIGDQVF
jgi:plasmid stability protein